MKLVAKIKKNQSALNKAIQWLEKYNIANDRRDDADVDGNIKIYNKYDRVCEKAFDKYLDWCNELPKYEISRIEKSEIY